MTPPQDATPVTPQVPPEEMEPQPDVFETYRGEVRESVHRTMARIEAEEKTREYPSHTEYPLARARAEVSSAIANALPEIELVPADVDLQIPPGQVEADFALPAFRFAKAAKRNPVEVAKLIAASIGELGSEYISEVSVAGPFINLRLNRERVYPETLGLVERLGDQYGASDVHKGEIVLVDYSAPNIAKPIGVGHLRSTIIGQSLGNIYEATGYSVIRDNHLGDWGKQFGTLLYAYQHWGDPAKVEANPIQELKDLYVRFHEEAHEHPEYEDEARSLFTALEQKNPELVGLWKHFRDLSLADFERTYQRLGITFDTSIGESFYADEAPTVTQEALDKGLARKDENSELVIVEDLEGLPTFLLQKQDGSSLYVTRDLATIQYREASMHPDVMLYVVGSEQDVNFQQLFALGRKLGYLKPATTAKHINFGMVLRDGKKMSTRKGTLVELEDLISQSVDKSKAIIHEKNPDMDEATLAQVAEDVGIGAILYNDVGQSREKNISFDWDRMLDMKAGSAVYLQYTHARIQSILRKASEVQPDTEISEEPASFVDESEYAVAKQLMLFPSIIEKAQLTDGPHCIATYLEELAQQFNTFYQQVSVLGTENPALRSSRLKLIGSVATVIKNGLKLLNIKAPSRM